ncbi:MAG: tetratricopeptide repeat protein [Bacteroidota bacterium]
MNSFEMGKNLLFITALTIVCSINIYADQSMVDSLLSELETAKEDTNKVNILNNLSKELQSSNPDKALNYAEQALKLSKKLSSLPDQALAKSGKKGIAISFNNIGIIHKNWGNYEKAIEYYLKALKIQEDLGNKDGIAGILNNIGNIYIIWKNYTKALEFYSKSLQIVQAYNLRETIMYDYEVFSKTYSAMGNYQKAYEYYKLYSQMKDSLFNEEKSKEIGKLEARYEFEKAEADRKRIGEEQARIAAEQV